MYKKKNNVTSAKYVIDKQKKIQLNMIKYITSLQGYKASLPIKKSKKAQDFDLDKSEQYSTVRLAMAAIYKVNSEKIGPEKLSILPRNFNSMDKVSRDKHHIMK